MNLKDNISTILSVTGDKKDPNLQDVPDRDKPKYLREQYWIEKWGPTKRWKNRNFINCGGHTKLRTAGLERKLDDPGDAFYELFLTTSKSIIYLRTWIEVTEVFVDDEQAKKLNKFIREYNGLRGKGEIDPVEFLRSLNLGPPDSRMQHEMADRVILTIEKKARKGQEGGSYKSLVHDYGRGQLIVGLPLWFASYPSDPTNPSIVLTDFAPRLLLGLEQIKDSILRRNWCPFDSIVVLWNPTLVSIDEWVKVADPDYYLDPANMSWKTPISPLNLYSFLKKHNLPAPDCITGHVRFDRYTSVDAMLSDQRRWLRLPNNPRPLGPKSRLYIKKHSDISSRHLYFYGKIFQLWLFVKLHGWNGVERWITKKFSIRRLFSRIRLSRQARQLYRSSLSDRPKS